MKSFQFKIGLALLVSGFIWVLTKFEVFNLSDKAILSLLLVLCAIVVFNEVFNSDKRQIILISLFVFFAGVYFFVSFIQGRNNFILSQFSNYLFYIMLFASATFFVIESFSNVTKKPYFLSGMFLYLLFIVILFLRSSNFVNSFFRNDLYNSIQKLLLSLFILAIIFHVLKSLIELLKKLELIKLNQNENIQSNENSSEKFDSDIKD